MTNPLLSARKFYTYIKKHKDVDNITIVKELIQFLPARYNYHDLLDLIKVTKGALP